MHTHADEKPARVRIVANDTQTLAQLLALFPDEPHYIGIWRNTGWVEVREDDVATACELLLEAAGGECHYRTQKVFT